MLTLKKYVIAVQKGKKRITNESERDVPWLIILSLAEGVRALIRAAVERQEEQWRRMLNKGNRLQQINLLAMVREQREPK